jgi:carbon storage regulator CsrA
MLFLSTKPSEKVVIGSGITVAVVEITGNRVRLGIDAPHQVHIQRCEIAGWQDEPAGRDGRSEHQFVCEW